MPRYLPLAVGFALLTSPVRAEDIPAATVAAVKKAAVFVRVQGDGWGATGSGFVVGGDEKTLYIATNHHVAEPDPPAGARPGRPPALSVVFDSGTKAERVFPAAVAGSDAQRDLAVLRVANVKDPPKALTAADTGKLTETATVYTFGFPFGEALSTTDKTNPAITVGKASVSSFRNGTDGELAAIQIDGNLNPGNSGGPVVNAAGQFVGVAVSRIKSAGIGFIVPAGELVAMMRGRVSNVRVVAKSGDTPAARIEAIVADPTGRLKEAFAYFLLVPPDQKPPAVKDLIDHPDSRKILLKVEKGVGVAEVPLKAAGGQILLQIAAEAAGGAEEKPVVTAVKPYPLTAVPSLTDVLGPPPAGWKEYMPSDKSFKMWVPEKPAKQANDERTSVVNGQRMRVSVVAGETAAGLVYEGQTIRLPLGGFNRPNGREMHEVFRDALAEGMNGKVTESKPVRSGRMTGYEHRIEVGKQVVRMRVCIFVSSVLIVQVTGTAEQVTSAEAETMLISFGFAGAGERPGPNPGTNPVAPPPVNPPGGGAVTVVPSGPAPTIVGGGDRPPFGGPVFKDLAPTGGLLIGVEVVVGRPYGDELVRSVKPIYLTGAKESFGKQFGTVLDKPVTLKAKAGYAVGGISVKARNVCDGFSLTFMKVVNGKLDPKDSYESEWVGWNGAVAAKKTLSDGPPAVGFAGRANDRDVCGVGVVLQGQEAFTAPAKPPTILGGAFDPEFAEVAPNGGLLVGLEVGTAQAFGHNMTRAARPIYRAGDKESFGEQRGTQLNNVVTLKAKPGYAVGAVSVMSGLGFDGIKLTFMKVADGKLDPADSYDSEYVGSDQKKPLTKLGGDGTPVVGVVGKANAKDLTGFGLLQKGQEGYTPKR